MLSDPELSNLLDQAARNLETLERLARTSSVTGEDPIAVLKLRQRLAELKLAYITETAALTRQVLRRAVERRVTGDRRQGPRRQSDS